ncbi:MAG: GNAT family N-acetyltransferase [Flavisolibacter sp.]|nr:GNAT family N-acetyltransferase [Flavisolibacter sp.]
MDVRIIRHDSVDYKKMIALRLQVLLQPIGVPASYINQEKEKQDILIGAFEDDTIVGCCILTPKSKSVIQLRQMAVHAELQNKGIGRKIIAFAENTSRETGFDILIMHARNPVIEFYKKCGYTIAGEEFFEVGIAHHKMQKQL